MLLVITVLSVDAVLLSASGTAVDVCWLPDELVVCSLGRVTCCVVDAACVLAVVVSGGVLEVGCERFVLEVTFGVEGEVVVVTVVVVVIDDCVVAVVVDGGGGDVDVVICAAVVGAGVGDDVAAVVVVWVVGADVAAD